MLFFLSFKFQINDLWGVAISIQIHTHELKRRQFFIQIFCFKPITACTWSKNKRFREDAKHPPD